MKQVTRSVLLLSLLLGPLLARPARAQAPARPIVIEDFEHFQGGDGPYTWKRPHSKSRSLLDIPREVEHDDDYFEIVVEGGNKVAHAYSRDESTQIVRVNGEGYRWDLRTHPRLAWDWRAKRLPTGAREDESKRNDAGAALYVTFGKDWLGRPRSIKYTYSTTLPAEATVKYGPLRVLVATSGAKGFGAWIHVERDVVADYRRVFGGDPPETPLSITLWSDSDDTKSVADVYFDNLTLLPAK